MTALHGFGGIFESLEFSGFRDDLDFWVKETSVGQLFAMNQERNMPGPPMEGRKSPPIFRLTRYLTGSSGMH
jgi:hypothetical protein